MGIDVFTAPLSAHLNHLRPTSSFGQVFSDLTAAAMNAHRERGESRLGLSAAWRARSLVRLARAPQLRIGHRWSPPGPFWLMEPDKMDPRCWGQTLRAVELIRSGVDRAEALTQVADADRVKWPELHDTKWDDLPGVLFVRAVETVQALIIPGMERSAFYTGGVAIASTREANSFLRTALASLGIEAAALEQDFDPDEPPELGAVLYNLRLFHHHVRHAEALSLPIGIFG